MRQHILFALLFLLFFGGWAAWFFHFSPYTTQKHTIQRSLAAFEAAASTGRSSAVTSFLGRYMAPEARVTLTVAMPSTTPQPALEETFSKPEFLKFIDLTLYSLAHYSLHATLGEFSARPDGSANITVHVIAAGDDKSFHTFGPGVVQHFALEGDCADRLSFNAKGEPVLEASQCKLVLYAILAP